MLVFGNQRDKNKKAILRILQWLKNHSVDLTEGTDSSMPFKLGSWIIQPACNELIKPKQAKTIESKAMETLLYLKTKHPHPVPNNELLENVWKDTVVSENTVRRIITQLRKALEDNANQPEYIKTVPRKGYQLVAPIEPYQEKQTYKPVKTVGLVFIALLSLMVIGFNWNDLTNSHNPEAHSMDGIDWRLNQITHLVGYEITPSLSPDGQSMLFAHETEQTSGPNIYWRNLTQLNNILVKGIPGNAIAPIWSPDGKHVVFINLSGDKCQVTLAKVEQQGKKFNQLVSIAECDINTLSRVSWRNSQEFFYRASSNSSKANKVYTYNIETNQHQRLSLYESQPQLQLSHIASPIKRDQKKPIDTQQSSAIELSYITRNGFFSELWVKKNRLEPELIHRFKGNIRALKFCGIEQRLIVMQHDTLWRLGDNLQLNKLSTTPPDSMTHLGCASTSSKIVIASRQLTSNINVIKNPVYNGQNLATNKLALSNEYSQMQPSASNNGWPSFANRSNQLAFITNRNKDWEILLFSNGTLSNVLKNKAIELQGYPFIWSPDDTKALIMQADQTLSVYNIQSDSLQTIATAEDDIFTLEWSSDGKGIFYVEFDSRYIHYLNLGTGAKKLISKIKATDIVSVDKSTLFFTKAEKYGLWKLDLTSGDTSLVIPELHYYSQFRVYDKGIYFNGMVDTPGGIFYFDRKTAKTRELFPNEAGEYGHQFSISFDQSLIAYSKYDNYQADIYQLESSTSE